MLIDGKWCDAKSGKTFATYHPATEEKIGGMIVVDTSVWIRFLANRVPFAGQLDGLLRQGEVCGHDFVFGELLIGDKGGRKKLLADYALMNQAPVVPHREVVEFVRQRRLHGSLEVALDGSSARVAVHAALAIRGSPLFEVEH
jgi:predicted nucleic acid-binding protein